MSSPSNYKCSKMWSIHVQCVIDMNSIKLIKLNTANGDKGFPYTPSHNWAQLLLLSLNIKHTLISIFPLGAFMYVSIALKWEHFTCIHTRTRNNTNWNKLQNRSINIFHLKNDAKYSKINSDKCMIFIWLYKQFINSIWMLFFVVVVVAAAVRWVMCGHNAKIQYQPYVMCFAAFLASVIRSYSMYAEMYYYDKVNGAH